MPTVKISQLPAAASASQNAIVPATNATGTATEKVTLGQIASLATSTGAAALPTSGLTITRSGDWVPQQPTQFFLLVPAQAVQVGNTYVRYTGKWIAGWAYSESSWVTGQTRITELTFNDLEGVTGNFFPNTMAALTSLSLPNLSYVGGSVTPNGMNALTTLSLPNLSYLVGQFSLSAMAALTTISLPALKYLGNSVGTSLNLTAGLNALTAISLPALERITGSISVASAPALADFTLPTDGRFKWGGTSVSITGAALPQASVDNILQAYASLDGTNGTTSWVNTLNLSGGTSAAPSNLGSTTTAGSNFVCAGTTCTVNWTGHGYATGDVLRISGITTATNANRYAVITVVNANQFTYTITSQTATGAGTATVVLAGASAKTLVTRGVTLTTN
jgi:hypothetical protein